MLHGKQFLIKPSVVTLLLVSAWLVYPLVFDVQPVYLTTDIMIFLLVIFALYLAAYINKTEYLRRPWQSVFRTRRAVISLLVLVSFIITGLIDSVHMRKPLATVGKTETQYSVEVTSVLDELLYKLKTQNEKTYSAPFALTLYSKETITNKDGTQSRIYPHLIYAGAHLADEKGYVSDILFTILYSMLVGLMMSLIACSFITYVLYRKSAVSYFNIYKKIFKGVTEIPWRSMYLTLTLIMTIASVLYFLSEKYHVLGTDKVGQDVLYLSIKSIRTGLVIGTLTTLVMLPFAIILGLMAGYFRGWIDDIIQYTYTVLSSIPGVLLIAAAILSIQVYIANHPELFETGTDRADLRLLALCVILGITSWSSLCRLLRGETLKLRELDYVQAATAFGVGHSHILVRHILPNVLHIILIIVVLDFSGLVLAEAVLSYVGVGVDPSTISWGNMINGARLELAREPMVWWSLVAAFIFMFTLVLSANLFADAVRDAFDPRLQGRGV